MAVSDQVKRDSKPSDHLRSAIITLLAALSGFIAGMAMLPHITKLNDGTIPGSWLIAAGFMFLTFVFSRRKWPSFANISVAVGAMLIGLIARY